MLGEEIIEYFYDFNFIKKRIFVKVYKNKLRR